MARKDRMAKPAKMLLNVPAIQADFPILKRTVRDKRLVYLDSAATSQKPKQVIEATSDYYSRYNANVHRAIYELGEESTGSTKARGRRSRTSSTRNQRVKSRSRSRRRSRSTSSHTATGSKASSRRATRSSAP